LILEGLLQLFRGEKISSDKEFAESL